MRQKNLSKSLLFLIIFLNFITLLNSGTPEESNTGALLSFPYKANNDILFNVSWEVAPAQFGFQDYGGSLLGYLVLPANTSYSTECSLEPNGLNNYIHFLQDWTGQGSNLTFILLIDRGDCYFTTKVENAQNLGAKAVIVLDNRIESEFTMWPPDDWHDDVRIPSALLDEINSKTLMNYLGVIGWNTSPNNVTYPNEYEIQWTIAKLEWGLPHDDDRVEWEIWTSSNDDISIKFKQNFKDTQLNLSLINDTIFTPHYYILNGSHWSCDDGLFRCRNQCTNSGRYCYVDPEYDLNRGLDGSDVIEENLRQLCIWNYSKTYQNESIWWNYVILWDLYCFNYTENEITFNVNCSYLQMNKIIPNNILINYVNICINQSGGVDYTGGINSLLDAEVHLREQLGIYTLPSVIVNEFTVHGNIDCNIVTTSSCTVLDAICAGFLNNTQPNVCNETPSPTPVTCSNNEKDCSGICYGLKVNDSCGHCLLTNDPNYNSCVGCDGIPNSGKTKDCEGKCGGNKQFNDCGYCIAINVINFNNYGKDCTGICFGNNQNDSCGQCILPSDSQWNYCIGCDGIAYSNKTYDCKNKCGGNALITSCGTCLDRNDPNFNTSCTSNSLTNDNNNNNTSMTIVIIISVLSILIILGAGVIIYRLWKKQQIADKRFNTLLKQYTLMDEDPMHSKKMKGKHEQLNTEESEDGLDPDRHPNTL